MPASTTTLRRAAPAARVLAALIVLAPLQAAGQATDSPSPGSTQVQGAPASPAQEAPPATPPTAVQIPSGAAPAPTVTPRAGEVLLNFQAADLQAVVRAISQMTGRNLLVDPRVRGQFTIVSARPMPVSAAYQVFVSALKAQGFTAVEGAGGVVRIIPVAEAKASAPVNERDGPPRGGEQVVTHVAIGQHISVAQLQNVLRPLMSPTSQLSVYDPANALIITDYADNVRRLLRIIDKIDLPSSTDVTLIPLQHASAIDVGELVVRLSGTGVTTAGTVPGAPPSQIAAGGDRFSVVPDTRTNSLLLRSDNPGRIEQLRSLIAKLDVPARGIGSTRVIYLRNAQAIKLVEVLRGMLAAGAGGASAPPGAARAAGAGRSAAAEPSLIQADEATNSIIINASDTVYNNLRMVIEQLDIRRAQVYVEGLIVEMTADRTDELGIQWAGGYQTGGRTFGAATNFTSAAPSLAEAAGSPATAAVGAAGLVVGVLGRRITLSDGTTVQSLGALARALQANSLGNILSTPNLLTLDNAEAKIIVGQNVPILTGSFAQATSTGTAGAAVNPFQTIERRDIGLTLKLKPQISEGGAVRLEIYQEVSSIDPTSRAGASDVVLTKRALETKIVVDDGQTIVLGGLIQNNVQETVQSVPLLGNIPILGALFRYKKEIRSRTNLMIFLRPVIIRSAEDSYRVTTDRYEYLRAYTRGEGPEREGIYDRIEPAPPAPSPGPAPAPSGAAPAAPAVQAAPAPPPPGPLQSAPDRP
jgi:general secretion pathway protein D